MAVILNPASFRACPARPARSSPSGRYSGRLWKRGTVRGGFRRDRLPIAGRAVAPDVVVGRAETFVDEHLADPNLDLQRLAEAAGVSVSTLGRSFRSVRDTTPWQHVLTSRIERAKDLLVSTDRPLATVALDAGFYDQPHLTRTFREMTGTTPGTFRKSYADRVEEVVS